MADEHLTPPRLVEMRDRPMAVVRTVGSPGAGIRAAEPVLRASNDRLRDERGIDVPCDSCALRSRWPNADEAPVAEWVALWALPIPEGVDRMPQVDEELTVEVERWEYGELVEALHVGPMSAIQETVEAMREFTHEEGYELFGPQEEEYLPPADSGTLRTLVRYRIAHRF
jgi:hypothetical protein